ncbi:hypothetical protein V498_06457 [Pseudogymnoascus sp. VKM F-4517 (FW-2822)]|nr:hypothetical protein V498_06457 [Pseudogymnoascus sp. VKM F-4517 (FW-2822)]
MTGLEALVAVGLAGNIVQFTHFAQQLLSGARKLYRSTSGATAENTELELITKNIRKLAETEDLRKLAESTQQCDGLNPVTSRPTNLDRDEEDWMQLNQQCKELAVDLLKLLGSFKVKADHRRWEIVRQSIRIAWKKSDIESMQQRLDRIGSQLHSKIGGRQREQILQQMEDFAKTNAILEVNRAKEIQQLRQDLEKIFEEIKSPFQIKNPYSQAWGQLPGAAERAKNLVAERLILNRLGYLTMEYRHQAISKEHAKTFQWIYEPTSSDSKPWTNFVHWLEEDHGLYWITGKPGSGKSTLMKFISAHPNTRKHLQTWARGRKLVTASFYFWSPAKNQLQKSQVGLLRSILYQIFRQCPDWILRLFPVTNSHLESGSPENHFDTVEELLCIFRRLTEPLTSQDGTPSTDEPRFCFFIDGLDEYDGNPQDIIEMVGILRHSPHIKICVASRPWNEFETAFGLNRAWMLCVHDLTRDDIRLYTTETLGEDVIFQQLRKMDDRCPDLVEDVVKTAEGVFLWVFLVVRSLLEGLSNADRISDLQKRLSELPTDLESYFERLLYSVDERYQEQMSTTFIVTLRARKLLPVFTYWHMDEDVADDYVFDLETKAPPSGEARHIPINHMKKRLNARCKGLMEAKFYEPFRSGGPSSFVVAWQVDFLHRTVRDFLALANMQKLLHSRVQKSYNADLAICRSVLATFKTTIELAFGQESDTELLDTFCYHMDGLDSLDDASRTQMRLAAHMRSTLIARGGCDFSGDKLSRFSNIQPSPNLEQLENAFIPSALRESRSENV